MTVKKIEIDSFTSAEYYEKTDCIWLDVSIRLGKLNNI